MTLLSANHRLDLCDFNWPPRPRGPDDCKVHLLGKKSHKQCLPHFCFRWLSDKNSIWIFNVKWSFWFVVASFNFYENLIIFVHMGVYSYVHMASDFHFRPTDVGCISRWGHRASAVTVDRILWTAARYVINFRMYAQNWSCAGWE